MAITANVTISDRGLTMNGAYLQIPEVALRKHGQGDSATFSLTYAVRIYKDADTRNADSDGRGISLRIKELDKFKINYSAGSNNPFALAYADLKTKTDLLSSITDA